MPLPVFERAAERLLARLGEEALLRGTEVCRVHLEYGVEVQVEEGQMTFERTVATIPKSLAPKRGDSLVVGAVTYTIDSPQFSDTGVTVRVVLR